MSADVDVVVCGAGIGGLATACALGELGLRVLLVDKQSAVRPIAKGEVLQPGALAALRGWGAERRLHEIGALRLDRIAVRDQCGEALLAMDYAGLPGADRDLLAHDYPSILGALDACLGPTVEVARGVLAEGLRHDASGRVAGVRLSGPGRSYEVRANLVVAADGIASRLRRAAGIETRRADYPHRLLSFEIAGADERPQDFSTYVTDRGMRLCYPLPGRRVRLYLQVGPDELRGMGTRELTGWCRTALSETPPLRPLTEPVLANLRHRQLLPVSRFLAPRLAVPGMALVGEAAHAVHPLAAQGMHTSVADAVCLAGELAAAGDFSASSVDTALLRYQRRRRPELVQTGRMSHNATRMVTDTSWRGRWFGRRAARRTAANARLLYLVTFNMSGIGMRPLSTVDRLHQFGVLPDHRAHRVPVLSPGR